MSNDTPKGRALLTRRSRKAYAAATAISLAAAALILVPGSSNALPQGARAHQELFSANVVGDITSAANSLVLNFQTKKLADVDSDATTANSSAADLNLPAGATVEVAYLHWMAKTKGSGASRQAAPATPADATAWVMKPGETTYNVIDTGMITLDSFTDDLDPANPITVWMASADITELVTASGSYTVSVPYIGKPTDPTIEAPAGDIHVEGPEMAGWNMTVIYSVPVGTAGAKLKHIKIVDGFTLIQSGENISFSSDEGIQTPTSPSVSVAVVALGGDTARGDYLRVAAGASAQSGTDITNGLNPLPGTVAVAATTNVSFDIFNGTISNNGADVATRSPGYAPGAGGTAGTGFTARYGQDGVEYTDVNQFGNDYSAAFDADTFDVSAAFASTSPTQVTVQYGSSQVVGPNPNDTFYPALATLAIELASPMIETNVSFTDLDPASAGIGVGDKIQVTITARNIGPEGGKAAAVTSVLPNGLIYIPGSASVSATSLNPGSKSDAVATPDDGYSYNTASRLITWNLGTGPAYTLQANAADGLQTLTFEAYVSELVQTPEENDLDQILLPATGQAVSVLDADDADPAVYSNAGFAPTLNNPGTPGRHNVNLTTANVALEALTATTGRLRFKVNNEGPSSVAATVKWDYDATEFTPNVSNITGATCSTSGSGATSVLSCAITANVVAGGMSAEISVPLTFLKARETLKPGKIWVVKTGASSPDSSDIDPSNAYTTDTLYAKTAGGASTWPAIAQAAPFVVTADTFAVAHNTTLTVTAVNGLLKNDTGAGLSIVSNTNAVMAGDATPRGTLVVNSDGSFTFTPPTDFKGTLTFTYSAKSTDYPKQADGVTDRVETGTVTLTVADKVNVVNDTYYTPKGTALVVELAKGLFSNDVGGPFTLTSIVSSDSQTATVAANGSFTLTTSAGVLSGTKSDGSFTFTPTASFVGKSTYTYNATDALGAARSGTMTVEVLDKPEVTDDTIEATGGKLNFDPLKNDKGTGLKVTAFDAVSKEGGTIVQEIDGTLTFTPKTGYFGTDSFTYTVTDAAGQSVVGTVSIVIPEALAYTGDHVLAPISAGWLMLVAAMLLFVASSGRMVPVTRKP